MKKLPVIAEQAFGRIRVLRKNSADAFLGDQEGITCRKGCSHCCKHPLMISLAEGTLLYWHLRNNGLWTKELQDSLEKHSSLVFGLSEGAWNLAEIPCPLLKDDLCTAYSARPFMCRTKASMGFPELCEPSTSHMAPLKDNLDALVGFHEQEKSLFRELRSKFWIMPLSTAMLLGAKLDLGQLSIEEAYHEAGIQYIKGELA